MVRPGKNFDHEFKNLFFNLKLLENIYRQSRWSQTISYRGEIITKKKFF